MIEVIKQNRGDTVGRKTVYNSIVNEDDYAKVNEENKFLLEEFIDYLYSVGRAETTITNYESDIKICFIWGLKHNKNKFFVDYSKRDIVRYQGWLSRKLNLSPSRVRRLRSAISSMSNYIEEILEEDYPTFRNIVNSIEAPPANPVRKKTVFSNEDVENLLDKLVDEGYIQHACAVALAASSGSRKSELTRFKTYYFDEEYKIPGGALYATPEKIRTKGRGGGKMLQKFTLVEPFEKYLKLWLKEREERGIKHEYLFVKEDDIDSRATSTTLDSWAETINRFSEKHFYWHSLRHYFTTHLAGSGIPAEVIKQIVGWESVEMVSIYDDTPLSDELSKYFGGN